MGYYRYTGRDLPIFELTSEDQQTVFRFTDNMSGDVYLLQDLIVRRLTPEFHGHLNNEVTLGIIARRVIFILNEFINDGSLYKEFDLWTYRSRTFERAPNKTDNKNFRKEHPIIDDDKERWMGVINES